MSYDHLRHKRYQVSPGYSFSEIVIRETCGIDEQTAAQLAAERKNGSLPMEMIRRSIVAVDGVLVHQPFFDMDKWNTRSRQFILTAYEELNSVPEADMAVFKTASVEMNPSDLASLRAGQKQG